MYIFIYAIFFPFLAYYFYATPFQFSSLSRVRLFVIPWTAARQASLSIANSWSLLKLMSIESVMPSDRLILCHPLLLLPSIFPSIRVFSSEPCLLENIIWIDEAQLLISFIIHIFYPSLDIFAKSKVFNKIFLLCFLPERFMVLIYI